MYICSASISCGITYLNLPLEIWYKPEKMYITSIFGPKEPCLEQLNHYIWPFMDNMLIGLVKGIQFSRTASHSSG
jgi:hypothetical protein